MGCFVAVSFVEVSQYVVVEPPPDACASVETVASLEETLETCTAHAPHIQLHTRTSRDTLSMTSHMVRGEGSGGGHGVLLRC